MKKNEEVLLTFAMPQDLDTFIQAAQGVADFHGRLKIRANKSAHIEIVRDVTTEITQKDADDETNE